MNIKQDNYLRICEEITKVNIVLDYTRYLTPHNLSQENERFLINYNSGKEYNPKYIYESFNGLSFHELRQSVLHCLDKLGKSPLDYIFRRLLAETSNVINFYESRGRADAFTKNSRLSFGYPAPLLVKKAMSILENWKCQSTQQEKEGQALQCLIRNSIKD